LEKQEVTKSPSGMESNAIQWVETLAGKLKFSGSPSPIRDAKRQISPKAKASLQHQAGHSFVARTKRDPPVLFCNSRIEQSMRNNTPLRAIETLGSNLEKRIPPIGN
jgi:hypothetical protein